MKNEKTKEDINIRNILKEIKQKDKELLRLEIFINRLKDARRIQKIDKGF